MKLRLKNILDPENARAHTQGQPDKNMNNKAEYFYLMMTNWNQKYGLKIELCVWIDGGEEG